MIRLEVGCGATPREGYDGMDIKDFGQKYVHDVRDGLPFDDNSVDRIYCSHFIEHLDNDSVWKFLKECHRVLKKGCVLWIIVPHHDHEKAHVIWHKTFYTKYTFIDLEKLNLFTTLELVVNERPDIHWKAIKI